MSGNVPIPSEKDPFKIVRAVRELFEGRSNAVGSVTLAVNATSTTVTAINCGAGSAVLLFPKTASAAQAVAATADSPYVGANDVGNGQFVIRHSSLSSTDRTFWWVALG